MAPAVSLQSRTGHMNFSLALLQATPGGSALPGFMFQIAAIFAIFYFLLIRPQQKQKKAHDARLRALKRGEEIVTAGGVIGEVVHIREAISDGTPAPTMEDRITIRSGESKLVVERGRIARIISAEQAVSKPAP